MILILGLAALVALTSCDAAVENAVQEEGDTHNKQWMTTPDWDQTTPDEGNTSIAPGSPIHWRIIPSDSTATVGSMVKFDCSAYTSYHEESQVHIKWEREDENGTYTLFYDDQRWGAPPRMYVYVYGSDFYHKTSTLTIDGVEEYDYGNYTCHIFAENGDNELTANVQLIQSFPSQSVCQPGWHLHKDYCYTKIQHHDMPTWREANSYCSFIGVNSTLPSIHDASENQFIDRLLSYDEEVWIGYFYNQHYPGYNWIDGTYGWYENWLHPYPKFDEDEGCVIMNYWSEWLHIPCDGGNKTINTFICKAPAYEYVSAGPDNDCPWNWVGYRDDCYYVDPDSSDIACHDLHYYASTVYIQSPDENDFIVKLIKRKSQHQAQGTVRLHAYHDPTGGWKWYGGVYGEDIFYFKNWDAGDIVNMATNAEGIDLDMETGVWRPHTAPGVSMGTMCKLPKWASRLQKEVEGKIEGEKKEWKEKNEGEMETDEK